MTHTELEQLLETVAKSSNKVLWKGKRHGGDLVIFCSQQHVGIIFFMLDCPDGRRLQGDMHLLAFDESLITTGEEFAASILECIDQMVMEDAMQDKQEALENGCVLQ